MNEHKSQFDLNIIWKECAKDYSLKKKEHMLWEVKNDMIFGIFSVLRNAEGKYYLEISCVFKPLWTDDLFWDITGRTEFKEEPMSYRGIGSYVAPMKNIYINTVELEELNMDKAKKMFCKEIENILSIIERIREKDYEEENCVISNILIAIHNKEYKVAKSIIRKIGSPYNFRDSSLKKGASGADIQNWIFKGHAKKYIRRKYLCR